MHRIIFLCFLNYLQLITSQENELLAVTLAYRHGDRSPFKFYRNDPYKERCWWPEGPAQLTNKGKMQQYGLGKWLRKRYDGFLSQIYNHTEIYVHSSDADRCLMSALANLAGLYPPVGKNVWAKDMPWQPIPVHTTPRSRDDIVRVQNNCPKYAKLLEDAKKADYFKSIDRDNESLYAYLSNNTGENVKDVDDVKHIYDTLFIEQNHNLTLPQWTQSVYPCKLRKLTKIATEKYTFTKEHVKLFTGRFYDQLLAQFDYFSGRRNEVVQKFKVFSLHDSNVLALLVALSRQSWDLIPYAAALIFELRRSSNGEFLVRILYKIDETYILQIPICNWYCNYNDFRDSMKDVALTSDEYNSACQLVQ